MSRQARAAPGGAGAYLAGEQAAAARPALLELYASARGQLDQHAAAQAARDAVVPERGVALRGAGGEG